MTSRIISKAVLATLIDVENLFTTTDTVRVNIDSRTIVAGEIFIAIQGDINDGHDHIADAVAKGAALIIADKVRAQDVNALAPSIVFVDDTLVFFGKLARAHLATFNLTIIGITGSNGKTTTKEMLKAALARIVGERAVYASAGNKNNLFGVPLCALEVSSEHRYAIFEMGINQVGEMQRLAQIVEPDIAIITNISGAHAGNFVDGVDGIRREKGYLYGSIENGRGIAIINSDDEHCRMAAQLNFKASITVGHNPEADVRIMHTTAFSLDDNRQTVTMRIDNDNVDVNVPLAGGHHGMNAACALAAIKALGLPVQEAARGIEDMARIAGRMSITRNDDGVLIVDDGYNANPVSMKAGIMATRELKSRRRCAAIGTMGELGANSTHHHFELGALLANNFDYIFVCGEAAHAMVDGALSAGFATDRIVRADESASLIPPLKLILQRGDLLFIKGSLSANMQAIAKAFC